MWRRLALVLTLLAPACHGPDAGPPSFVFVLVDTLRKDRLGLYGNERAPTPFIDALGRDGLVYENAVAQSPWTASSMASLWTSRYPAEVGVMVAADPSGRKNIDDRPPTALSAGVPTLASVLATAGYRTIAVNTNPLSSARFGLLAGFDEKFTRPLGAAAVVDLAVQRLDRHLAKRPGQPFFLYLHLNDVHEPLTPPPPYDTRYPTPDGSPRGATHQRWDYTDGQRLDSAEFASFRRHRLALYDGALRYVDDQLRALHAHLGRRGLVDRTVVVIASDHGEEFWDHAEFERRQHLDPRGMAGVGHGHAMFRELLDVPLVVSGGPVPRGRIAAQVRNLDIMPTVLGLAGVDAGALSLRGVDLIARERAGTGEHLPAFSQSLAYGPEASSLQDARYKLVTYDRTRTGTTQFLFDKQDDPGETRSIFESQPALAARYQAARAALLTALVVRPGRPVEMAPRLRRRLRALGYVQ